MYIMLKVEGWRKRNRQISYGKVNGVSLTKNYIFEEKNYSFDFTHC